MSFAFLSKMFKVQGKKIKEGLTQAAVGFDPESATEAEIEMLEDQFNDLLVKLGNAQVSLDRERVEAKKARETYNKYMNIAENLQTKMETEATPEVESALATALEFLESNVGEMEREEQEAVEAESYFNEVKATVEVLRNKLMTAKKSIEAARKDMEKAKLRKERAAIKAENAAALAGLRDSSDALGVATKAMLKTAEEAQAEATAMETKASMLGAATPKNELLDQMLSNEGPAEKLSMKDRLARLKK